MKLNQVSTYERGISSKSYPSNSVLIQMSATKGEIKLIKDVDVVNSKYLVIVPNEEKVTQKYLYYAMESNVERFLYKYQTGLNLTLDVFKHFDIVFYNLKTQGMIVCLLDILTEMIVLEERLCELWRLVKEYMLDTMFVQSKRWKQKENST